ncbi:MAG: NADH-quinone oxidoreductase subunit H [Candidatus Wallbacteria bacterium]
MQSEQLPSLTYYTAKIIIPLVQTMILIIISPLLAGIIKKVKAAFQFRRGPSIFQPYYDLSKYFKKEVILSDVASWIFTSTPYVVLASVITTALLMPSISYSYAFSGFGDIIVIIYLMALARFFMALAALDTASAFGGMASSREMMISSIAEPAMILCFISIAISHNSTNLSNIMSAIAQGENFFFTTTNLFILFGLFLIVIAETGRIPFDNPATHLELTMVHEGMILEYSGRYLAMMTLASYIKQAVLFTLIVNIFFPYGMMMTTTISAFILSTFYFIVKLSVFSIFVGIFESSLAKSRLFQIPDLAGISFVLALTSIIINVIK